MKRYDYYRNSLYGYPQYGYNPTFNPFYTKNYYNNLNNYEKNSEKTIDKSNEETANNSYTAKEDISSSNDTKKKSYRLGPINVEDNRVSAFGFSFALDDLILVFLVLFLLLENSCDYILIIVLGLMLFDITTSSLGDFNILKKLGLFS